MLKNKHHGTPEKAKIYKHQLWVQKKVMLIKKTSVPLLCSFLFVFNATYIWFSGDLVVVVVVTAVVVVVDF